MTLKQLEDYLKQARETGASDNSPVNIRHAEGTHHYTVEVKNILVVPPQDLTKVILIAED